MKILINNLKPKNIIAVIIKGIGTTIINAAAEVATPLPPLNFRKIVYN